MMITNCAKMRSFNCFTLIIGTVPPPGAERTPRIPTAKRNASFYAVRSGPSIARRLRPGAGNGCARQDRVVITGRLDPMARKHSANTFAPRYLCARKGQVVMGATVSFRPIGTHTSAPRRCRRSRPFQIAKLTLLTHRSAPVRTSAAGGVYPLPPEERELPDVLAGRHHQRTQGEHAGFAYGALELRKLCELVACLGVNRRLVHAALTQQEYALGAQRELPVQAQTAQHVRQVLAAEAVAQRLQVAAVVAVEEPAGIHRLQQLHVGVEIRVEPVA